MGPNIKKAVFRSPVIVVLLYACTSSLKSDIFSKVDRDCGPGSNSNCTVVMKDVTKFKWDKMYLFGSWTIADSISQIIGFNCDGGDVPDDYRRMLFVLDGKAVYEEDFKALDSYTLTLNFPEVGDSLRKSPKPYFTPEDAVFVVQKNNDDPGCKGCFAYSLTPINR